MRTCRQERFDVLPLSILTYGAVAELGADRRRMRPNILIGEVDGLAERAWPGRRLRIGKATVELVELRARCVTTTFDPHTLEQDLGVLQRIVRWNDGARRLRPRGTHATRSASSSKPPPHDGSRRSVASNC